MGTKTCASLYRNILNPKVLSLSPYVRNSNRLYYSQFFFVLLDEHGPWGPGLRLRFCKRIRSRVFKIMIFCDVGEGRGLMFDLGIEKLLTLCS